jgi:hypothetical protein
VRTPSCCTPLSPADGEPEPKPEAAAAAAPPPAEAPKPRRGRPRKSEAAASEEATARLAAAALATGAGGAEPAPSPVPVRWDAAAAAGASEEDPRRFGFHRRLQAAAERGDADEAAVVLSDMAAAGLPPGPRAWHVAVVAHLKGGDVDGALAASVKADEGACGAGGRWGVWSGRRRGHRGPAACGAAAVVLA